jgi:hypothetical protein
MQRRAALQAEFLAVGGSPKDYGATYFWQGFWVGF